MRQGSLGLLLTLGLAMGLNETSASSWPRFRGPNGTGVSKDKDVPLRWSAQEGILWKTRIPGAGHSSPVVWDDRIFVQSASEDGTKRMLVCLNAKDGKLLWTQTHAGQAGKRHDFNTLATSTPATDGQAVYTVYWDGRGQTMEAYDFDGKKLWERPLGRLVSQHGAGASPMVFEGRVYLNNDMDGTAVVVALDAKTGKIAWEASRKAFRASYATPFVLERPDAAPELIVASTAGFTAYNPQTGAETWSWTWAFDDKALRVVSSPIYDQGHLFATSGDGGGNRHAVAVHVNGGKPTLAWENKKALPYVPSLLAQGEHLYFVTDKGMASCCVARTGEVVWSERLGTVNITASPVLIDGKVYAINDNGDTFVFEAAPTFKLLARNALGEAVRASPAVADGRLYLRGKEHLFCIGKK